MKPYLETLDINGHDSHKECMHQEPVCNEDDDRERTELSYGARREHSQNSEDGVVRNNLQRVGSTRVAQTLCYSLLDWECNGCFDYSVDLFRMVNDGSMVDFTDVTLTILYMFSTPMNTTMIGNNSQGTIVTRNPTRAQTLTLVMVLTTISTRPVKARPKRECTMVIRRKSQKQ